MINLNKNGKHRDKVKATTKKKKKKTQKKKKKKKKKSKKLTSCIIEVVFDALNLGIERLDFFFQRLFAIGPTHLQGTKSFFFFFFFFCIFRCTPRAPQTKRNQ
jgi:hypothetical protein